MRRVQAVLEKKKWMWTRLVSRWRRGEEVPGYETKKIACNTSKYAQMYKKNMVFRLVDE